MKQQRVGRAGALAGALWSRVTSNSYSPSTATLPALAATGNLSLIVDGVYSENAMSPACASTLVKANQCVMTLEIRPRHICRRVLMPSTVGTHTITKPFTLCFSPWLPTQLAFVTKTVCV